MNRRRDATRDAAEAAGLPQLEPFDAHNRELAENVRPADWRNPQPAERYNLVVLGAGTAGLVAAAGAAGLGAKVALVEKALLGGDCLNVGCVPSKALIRCARAAAEVRGAHRYGVRVEGEVRVDFPAVMERMRRLRAGISPHDSVVRFRDLGVDVFIGEGRFVAKDAIEVDGRRLRFAAACIATGARAAVPPIDGLADVGFLTNETVFSLTELPARLAVIGAGPIGCELAQAFARFGARVTLVEQADGILGREDRDAARIIERALEHDGVEIRVGTKLVRVEKSANGKRLFFQAEGAGDSDIVVDEVLVGVGRAPNVEGLGLDHAGVAYDRHEGVRVDPGLRTTNHKIYAAGDVCLPYKFTHTADAAARIVLRNALFYGRAKSDALHVPWCTYTDPEVAHVGLYEQEAREKGVEVVPFTVQLAEVDRAVLDGETEGFLKVLVKKGSDEIVGATLVSSHAGETITELTAAMVTGSGLGKLADTIHCYPTQAEVIKRAADAFNRTRLTPFVRRVFERLLAWRR